MKRSFSIKLTALGLALCFAQTSEAALVFYTSEAAFDAAAGALTTQMFDIVAANAGVGVGGGNGVNNPLNNGTNSAMLPGLDITATTGNGGDVALLGPNFGGTGLTNYSVFSNFGAGLNFSFAPGVTAASLSLLSLFSASNVAISVFDPSSSLLGSTSSFGQNTGAGQFWGVIADGGDVIGTLSISASAGPFPGADRVQWGEALAVPEPETNALMLMGLTALGFVGRSKKAC